MLEYIGFATEREGGEKLMPGIAFFTAWKPTFNGATPLMQLGLFLYWFGLAIGLFVDFLETEHSMMAWALHPAIFATCMTVNLLVCTSVNIVMYRKLFVEKPTAPPPIPVMVQWMMFVFLLPFVNVVAALLTHDLARFADMSSEDVRVFVVAVIAVDVIGVLGYYPLNILQLFWSLFCTLVYGFFVYRIKGQVDTTNVFKEFYRVLPGALAAIVGFHVMFALWYFAKLKMGGSIKSWKKEQAPAPEEIAVLGGV